VAFRYPGEIAERIDAEEAFSTAAALRKKIIAFFPEWHRLMAEIGNKMLTSPPAPNPDYRHNKS